MQRCHTARMCPSPVGCHLPYFQAAHKACGNHHQSHQNASLVAALSAPLDWPHQQERRQHPWVAGHEWTEPSCRTPHLEHAWIIHLQICNAAILLECVLHQWVVSWTPSKHSTWKLAEITTKSSKCNSSGCIVRATWLTPSSRAPPLSWGHQWTQKPAVELHT